MGETRVRERLEAIQILRGIAALAVVLVHSWLLAWHADPGWRADHAPALLGGDAGVDLFFVLSGFIMVHVASAPPGGSPPALACARRAFALRRLVRVVPVHWIVTAATLGWLLWQGPPPGAAYMAASFLYIPFSPDGSLDHVVPLVEPAWTLGFELLFYAVFALCLTGRAGQTVLRVSLVLAGLVGLGMLLPVASPAWLFTWTRPILLEFIPGMMIGLARQRGWRLPGWLAAAMIAGGLALLLVPVRDFAPWQGWGRVAATLPWASLAVAGAALGAWRKSGQWPRWLITLGDASYALYIWHMLVLLVWRQAWLHVPGHGGTLFFVAGTALSLITGLAGYRWLEQPLTARLRRLLPS